MTPHQLGTSRISNNWDYNYRDYIVFIFCHFTMVYSIFNILFVNSNLILYSLY